MLAGTCSQHHQKECETCKAAADFTNAEICRLHDELERLHGHQAADRGALQIRKTARLIIGVALGAAIGSAVTIIVIFGDLIWAAMLGR